MSLRMYFFLFALLIILMNFNFIHAYNSTQKIICESGSETVTLLNFEELIFFESANLPSAINASCNLTFVLNSDYFQNISNLRWGIAFTNAIGNAKVFNGNKVDSISFVSYHPPHLFTWNITTELTIQLSYKNNSQSFFQGHIYVDDWKSGGCAFESVARINPFIFEDETQIIYIGSAYYIIDNSNCLWHFIIPENYMFKFVLVAFNGDETAMLEIFNGKDQQIVIVTAENYLAKQKIPFYFNERYITISYRHSGPNNAAGKTGPVGYASITKITPITIGTENECFLFKNENNITTWNIVDYPNNIKCQYNFTITFGTEVHFSTKYYFIEEYVENLTFYTEGEVVYYSDTGHPFVFSSQANGFHKQVMAEFRSDGSVQSAGFKATFTTIECKCRPSIILPCSDEIKSKFTFMDNDDGTYCGNYQCNITLIRNESCPFEYYQFTYDISLLRNTNDLLSIFSNGERIFSWNLDYYQVCNGGATQKYEVLIFASNDNMIQLISQTNFNHILRTCKFYFISIDKLLDFNKIPEILITHENPYYTLELSTMPKNSIISVSMDQNLIENNDVLEVYPILNSAFLISYFAYYSDRNLTTLLESKMAVNHFDFSFKYIAENHTLTVYIYGYTLPFPCSFLPNTDVIFFRALKKHSEGCRFKNNMFLTFNALTDKHSTELSMVSELEKECDILIFKDPGNFNGISQLFTTARNQTCKIYAGNIKDKTLFDRFDAHIWQDVLLFSRWYLIRIPSNSSLLITTKYYTSLNIDTYPYKSLWTTENYGTALILSTQQQEKDYEIGEHIIANFTVAVLNFPYGFNLTINNSQITHVDQVFSFTNETVKFKNSMEFKPSNSSAVMKIETIPKVS